MTRLSKQQAKALGIELPAEKNKYGARKTDIDGIIFDSRKEAHKYAELRILKQAGYIKDFELQPVFELQPGYRDSSGKRIRPIKYIADFKITHKDGHVEIIDTKGFKTKEYLIKKKMLLFKYPDLIFKEE